MKKFLLTFILGVLGLIIFGVLSVSAASTSDLTYSFSNGGITITDCKTSASGELVIPENISGYPVTAISYYAFSGCTKITSITIPNSITTIGDSAFRGCTGLTRVNISDIEAWCNIEFQYGTNRNECNPLYYAEELYLNGELVTNLIIPDGVSVISDYLFYRCEGLESITIPDSVVTIGEYAFAYCRDLTSLTIPDGVTTIGYYAFYYCDSIQNITIGENVTLIDTAAFRSCTGLTSVSIPNNVTTVGNQAFYGCTNLTSVTIPNSVNSIGNHAFYNCSSLTDVYYNGTQGDWNEITIGTSNSNLKDAQRHYFLYVTYIDENGEIIREDIATSNTTIIFVVLPELSVKEGYEAKFYIDEDYTTEFNPLIQIVENTTLYVKFLKRQTPYTIKAIAIKDMSGNNLTKIPTGNFLATVSFTNVSSNEDAYVVLAQYTKSGAFKGLMYVQTEDVPIGSTMKLSIPVDNTNGDVTELKAFCWESFGSLIPLGNTVSFPLE